LSRLTAPPSNKTPGTRRPRRPPERKLGKHLDLQDLKAELAGETLIVNAREARTTPLGGLVRAKGLLDLGAVFTPGRSDGRRQACCSSWEVRSAPSAAGTPASPEATRP